MRFTLLFGPTPSIGRFVAVRLARDLPSVRAGLQTRHPAAGRPGGAADWAASDRSEKDEQAAAFRDTDEAALRSALEVPARSDREA